MKRNARTTGFVMALAGICSLNTTAFAFPYGTEKQAGAENQGVVPSIPASVLQVTGTSNSITVSAQHADVLSLLKLMFDQAHHQFAPDASVTGDVTLALAGQRFETVLGAICRQTFLRYEVDKQGIYRFHRDEEALRNLLLKTQAINAVLADQLRGMGYAVPPVLPQNNPRMQKRAVGAAPSQSASAFGGGFGGFGGGGGNNAYGRNTDKKLQGSVEERGRKDAPDNLPAPTASSAASKRDTTNDNAARGGRDAKADQVGTPQNRSIGDTQKPAGLEGPRGEAGPQGPAGPSGMSPVIPQANALTNQNRNAQLDMRSLLAPNFDLEDSGQYLEFIKQNKFVSVNTHREKMPVQQILADLSKQSGVPILIDPDVPKGEDFVVTATIPARPLNEMLNILGYYARLEWRWVNGRIYITTTPQLQLYLRGATLPMPGGTNIGGGITVLPQRSGTSQEQAPAKKTEDADKAKKNKDG